MTASALRRLAPSTPEDKTPDLILHHGSDPIPEYNNPDLIPGMYPTLYPFKIGSFEDASCPSPLSFEAQARYYLDLGDKVFRHHFSYIFVVLNMLQRRKSHLQTHFTVQTARFRRVADTLTSLDSHTIADAAEIIEAEKSTKSLTSEQKRALDLLRYVNTVVQKVPGSYAAKISAHADIRNYFSYFGLPHLFFTFNPSAVHSPIFQVMYGDKSVNLSDRYPKLPPSSERARRLAQDPVAAADFFEFSVNMLFDERLGGRLPPHKEQHHRHSSHPGSSRTKRFLLEVAAILQCRCFAKQR
ncbi:hypothetical protein FA15DRAFT_607005 [Coprinopsis marcescibilis]|uniref:Helitron helicase-like domain-containing protein n=1 Tax=Coprinopsis marcescibilis TaxID=230819 RepID=A0A5C3K937_COPMA|nr:hypothetical protein FA15DRAFT_607005 [Coprinopsis marcescibilis]